MSIIVSFLSKFALKKVISYIKSNSKEFLLFIVIFICFITIVAMSLRLLYRKKQVSKLEIQVEELETTNEYLKTEILNFSNKAYVKDSFTNTTTKIIMLTNDFYLTEEDIILRENFKHDFYK